MFCIFVAIRNIRIIFVYYFMKQSRVDQLADGIFAIVMTLLVFDIKVPELMWGSSNIDLFNAVIELYPLFLSYLLSFALLFSYWRSHHYIASIFAKNIDSRMTNINAIFLFFVALTPFSSKLLGQYNTAQTAIIIFALNIIFIGLSLYSMRLHAEKSEEIKNEKVTKEQNRHAYIRILFPVFCAVVAILVSFFHTTLALSLFTIGILFNFVPNSTKTIDFILETE